MLEATNATGLKEGFFPLDLGSVTSSFCMRGCERTGIPSLNAAGPGLPVANPRKRVAVTRAAMKERN